MITEPVRGEHHANDNRGEQITEDGGRLRQPRAKRWREGMTSMWRKWQETVVLGHTMYRIQTSSSGSGRYLLTYLELLRSPQQKANPPDPQGLPNEHDETMKTMHLWPSIKNETYSSIDAIDTAQGFDLVFVRTACDWRARNITINTITSLLAPSSETSLVCCSLTRCIQCVDSRSCHLFMCVR